MMFSLSYLHRLPEQRGLSCVPGIFALRALCGGVHIRFVFLLQVAFDRAGVGVAMNGWLTEANLTSAVV
jgi:hypothetical protein